MKPSPRLLALLLLAACGGGGADTPPDALVPDAEATPDAVPPTSCDTADGFFVYLNRAGGAFTKGDVDDPANDVSYLLDMDRTLEPWPYGDPSWNATVDCIRRALAPFNLRVVEAKPASGAFSEIVFTNTSLYDPGLAGLSLNTCTAQEPHVTYVFAPAIGDDPIAACGYAMFDLAIVTGLDTSYASCDYTTLLHTCTSELSWIDDSVQCGATSPAACRCTGQQTQNSFVTMRTAYGACP